jgi:hypothetical protein
MSMVLALQTVSRSLTRAVWRIVCSVTIRRALPRRVTGARNKERFAGAEAASFDRVVVAGDPSCLEGGP